MAPRSGHVSTTSPALTRRNSYVYVTTLASYWVSDEVPLICRPIHAESRPYAPRGLSFCGKMHLYPSAVDLVAKALANKFPDESLSRARNRRVLRTGVLIVYIGKHATRTWPWRHARGTFLRAPPRSHRVTSMRRSRLWPHISFLMRFPSSAGLFTRKIGRTRCVDYLSAVKRTCSLQLWTT